MQVPFHPQLGPSNPNLGIDIDPDLPLLDQKTASPCLSCALPRPHNHLSQQESSTSIRPHYRLNTQPELSPDSDGFDSQEHSSISDKSWTMCREDSSRTSVKRKGRGEFKYESAMMQGYGQIWEGVDHDESIVRESDSKAGKMAKEEKLQDGFAYRNWTEQVDRRCKRSERKIMA